MRKGPGSVCDKWNISKDTTDTDRSASYLDLHLEIDSKGRLTTKLYDKRDDFNFSIVNFSSLYEVYLIRIMNKSARRGAQFVPIGMPTVC
jgi:hypothetical protein